MKISKLRNNVKWCINKIRRKDIDSVDTQMTVTFMTKAEGQ